MGSAAPGAVAGQEVIGSLPAGSPACLQRHTAQRARLSWLPPAERQHTAGSGAGAGPQGTRKRAGLEAARGGRSWTCCSTDAERLQGARRTCCRLRSLPCPRAWEFAWVLGVLGMLLVLAEFCAPHCRFGTSWLRLLSLLKLSSGSHLRKRPAGPDAAAQLPPRQPAQGERRGQGPGPSARASTGSITRATLDRPGAAAGPLEGPVWWRLALRRLPRPADGCPVRPESGRGLVCPRPPAYRPCAVQGGGPHWAQAQ